MSDPVSGLTAPPAPAIPLASVSGNLGLQFSPPPGQVQAQAQPQPATGGGDVILRDAGGEYRVPKAEYDSLQAGGYKMPGVVVSGPSENGQGGIAPQQPPTNMIDRGVPLAGQDHAHQFIDWIGRNEGATWDTLYGKAPGWSGRLTQDGVPIVNGQPWQGAAGPDGRPTHAFGKGQFQPATWRQATRELGIDVTDASPVNQARVMLHLAQKRDPHFLDKFAAGDRAGLAATLGSEWTSLQPHSGSGSSGSTLDLRETALGPFNASAQAMVQNLSERYAKANQYYDQRIAKSERLETAAEAALAQWQAESTKPPQNMHEAWSQWNGIASVFALLGGLVGRNHTAAIAAAGTMLQAANSADSATYDRAYKQWSDHLDRGMKITELLLRDAREIASDATKPLHEINTELSTLSTAYQLYKSLDPNDVHNLILKDQQLRAHRDLIDAQNEQTDIRNAAAAKDQTWLSVHPEAKGAVPAEIHNQSVGAAEQERKGTRSTGWVVITDPTQKDSDGNQTQYRYNPNTGQATTLSGEPYQPGGAQKLGTGGRTATALPPLQVPEKWEGMPDVSPPGSNVDPGVWSAAVNYAKTGGTIKPPFSLWGTSALTAQFNQALPAAQKALGLKPSDMAQQNMQFAADKARLTALDKSIASPILQRNILSLNTVSDHLSLLRQYAEALKTHDTQLQNKIVNAMSTQTGWPEVINFTLAGTITGDEMVRLLTTTGGTREDRDGIQRLLSPHGSPDQLFGAINTASNFIRARFEPLELVYMQGTRDPQERETRRAEFREVVMTPQARQIFDAGQIPVAGATPTAAPGAAPPVGAMKGGGQASQAPAIPAGLQGKPGLQWSPSRGQWRDGAGQVYDGNGQPVTQ